MLKRVMSHMLRVPLRGAKLDKAMSGSFVGIKRQLIFIIKTKNRDFRIPLFILRPALAFQW